MGNLGLKEAKKLNEQPVMVMKEIDSVVATSFQTHSGKFFCLTRPKSISTTSENSPSKDNSKENLNNSGKKQETPTTCLSPTDTISAENVQNLEADKKSSDEESKPSIVDEEIAKIKKLLKPVKIDETKEKTEKDEKLNTENQNETKSKG